MPNEITNCLSVHGEKEEIKKLIEFVKSDNNIFDFNKIIPMPPSLNIERCIPLKESDSQIRMENFALYGHEDWYLWRLEHWGTKWNSWSSTKYRGDSPDPWISDERGIYQIEFNTAWTPPMPIFKKLQSLFPKIKLYSLWQDEMWFSDKWALGFGKYTEEEKKKFYGE